MRVLVTGGAGFIGYHVCKKLCENNQFVVGLDNLNDYYDVNLKLNRTKELSFFDNFEFVKLDIADNYNLVSVFEQHKFDYVIHLAAQAGVRYSLDNPSAYLSSNLVGFGNILEACRKYEIKHLVYASSSSVYGLNTKMPFSASDEVNHPVSLYAATKKSNELMAHSYSHLYDIPTTGLRFFTVYGPWGRPDMAPMLFASAISKGDPIKVFNNGDMQRDFTYIDDIVEGIMRVKESIPAKDEDWVSSSPSPNTSRAPYRVVNIGNGKPVDLMKFISTIEKKMGKTATKKFMPIQPGDVKATWADTSTLEEITQFTPETSIEEGVNKFIDWYIEYYK